MVTVKVTSASGKEESTYAIIDDCSQATQEYKEGAKNQPLAIHTALGWGLLGVVDSRVLEGRIPISTNHLYSISLCVFACSTFSKTTILFVLKLCISLSYS